MERRVRPAKRKRSERSYNSNENAKKPLLQVTLTKVKVSQEQLKRLQKRKLSTKNEIASNKDEEKNANSAMVNNKDASGSFSQITRESPVRHRLSNLLDGSVPSPYRDHAACLDYGDENVTNINCEDEQFNAAKSLSNPDSVKACLFDSVENSVDDDSAPLIQDQRCITVPCYPEVAIKDVLQVEEALTETRSASDLLTADVGVASAQEHCRNEVMNQHHFEKHSSKDGSVLTVPKQANEPRNAASNSSDVAVTDLFSGILPGNEEDEDAVHGVVDGEAREESEPVEDSGCGSMSSSREDNSLDYASGYNTLEVMNSLLSDLTEERNRRVELEERMSTMEERNKELLTESEKLKELVNDLLHLSKVKAESVSKGTQINMDISLRRGRTIDRATSPLRRNPSPDLQVLSFSIGCQTNPDEVEHPKMMSTLCQTDEEVIPPKILMSIASQTDLYMPVEVWPQARAAPQSASPTQVQQMVMPNFQATAPVQLQSSTHSTQASSVFQAANGQFYQMPLGQTSVQVNTLSNQLPAQIRASLQHPTTMSRTTALQSTGYQSAAFTSPLIRTSQASVGAQYTPSLSTNLNQGPSMLSRQTSNNQGLTNSNFNAYINAHNAMAQRNAVRCTPQTARQASQTAHRIAQGNGQAQHVDRQQYSAQQQANPTRTLQQTVDSRATFQSRIGTGIEQANRVNQIQHQRATAANQSARNPGQSSRTAYQQGISPQIPFARCVQPPVSQPDRQAHSHLRIQGNTVLTSQNQQGANLNFSTNQSAVRGRTMQQSVTQSSAVQAPLPTQGNPLMSPTYQSANLNASMNQSAISGVTVQQSVTQPVTGNIQQLHNQRNPVSVSQNQQRANLNLPINQTGATVQPSTQSPTISALVQTRSSNNYHDTIRQLSQVSMERNTAVSERQLRVQSSAQALSLYDEVRRVYSELQQSLDEITANKQKQRNVDAINSETLTVTSAPVGVSAEIRTPPCDSYSELTTAHITSSNLSCHSRSTSVRATPNVTPKGPSSSQAFNSDKTGSNRSSPSASLQTTAGLVQENGAREHVTRVSSNKDPHRKPPKTPSGALEGTVQRLLAKCTTSVADLFDGTLKSTSVESLQSELQKSNGRSVSLPEKQPRNESAHDCSRTLEPDTVEAVSLGQNERTDKGGRDRQVNSPEGISTSPVEIDVGEKQPVSEKTSFGENMKETGDYLINEEVGKEGATADGCAEESTDSNSDSVFIAPSTPVKRTDDCEKIKDDLYIYLMSPIIPPIATAKRVWPRIPQFNCDDVHVTCQSSENEDQGSDVAVQNTGSTDKAIENDPNQTCIVDEIQRTGKYTDSADPELTQIIAETQQDVRHVDSSDPENIETDPGFSQSVVGTEESMEGEDNVDKVKETVAEAKQDIAQTRGAVTKTNSTDSNVKNDPEVVVSVVGTEQSVQGGDNADEDMENVAEIEQSIADTHQGVTNAGNADLYVESVPGFSQSVVEAKESTEDEDNIGENMETDVESKQQSVTKVDNADPSDENDSVFTSHGVEAEESVENGENSDEDMEASGELKQSIAETQQAQTNVIIANPNIRGNDAECIPTVIEKEEFVDGRHGGEDKETSLEPTQLVVTNASSTDPSVQNDTQFAQSVVETEESMQCGDNPGAEPKEQAVTNEYNADPSVENDSIFAMHGMEAEEFVEDRKNADEDTEAGREPKQIMDETQQAETDMVIDEDVETSSEPTQLVVMNASNADSSVQNDTEFAQSVVKTEECTEFGVNPKEDMESAEPTRSINETQQAVMNAKNVDPDAEDDPEFSPNVVQTEGVLEDENNANAVTQQDDADHADLNNEKDFTHAASIVDTVETVAGTENTEKNPEATQNSSETYETTVQTQHGSGSLNSTEDNAQGHAVIPLLSEAHMQDMGHIETASTSQVLSTFKEIDQAVGSTKSSSRNHLSEDRSEELSKPQAPISHLKLESTLGLKSEDISKQDLFHLKSTFHDTPPASEFSSLSSVSRKMCDVEGMKKQLSENRQDPMQSDVNGKDIAGVQVTSKSTVDQNEKENAATNDPSQQHVNCGSFLPKPRLAVRSENNDLVIMWDLPLDNKVTEIEYYELYAWSRSGQWWKIAKIKALQLPMGCTVKNIVPGKMLLFVVRAVARNGVTGPFSETSGIFYSQNGQ